MFGILADILTFLSICLLAAPAFHINHYALRAARLSKIRFRPGFSKLDDVYIRAKADIAKSRDEWKPWKAWLLVIGTIFGVLAALASLTDHLTNDHSPASTSAVIQVPTGAKAQ